MFSIRGTRWNVKLHVHLADSKKYCFQGKSIKLRTSRIKKQFCFSSVLESRHSVGFVQLASAYFFLGS